VSRTYTDAEGRVAVGGNANLTGFGINDKGSIDSPTAPALVVGGNLNYNMGTITYGSALVGGTATTNQVGFGQAGAGAGLTAGSQPIAFAAAYADLSARSQSWGGLTANGNLSFNANSGRYDLTGNSSTLNVFSLTSANLASFIQKGLDLIAPTGSTILINVSGPTANFTQYQMFRNGNSQGVDTKVLWNFTDATSISMDGFSFRGSILAPNAVLTHNNGNIEGTAIVGSVAAGNGEFHRYLFTGDLPPPATPPAVPAPAGLVLVGIGALCGVGFIRRR
jgi:choice-of-anchor A domain-containing protein